MGKSHIAHTLRYNLLIKNILHLLPKYLSFVISQLNFFLCDASLTVENFFFLCLDIRMFKLTCIICMITFNDEGKS